ncbi:period circadian protein homolog 2-like [Salmo trutta]|uniref:period circadian protein homolog 2-like n=1 Tax=Salmo trutta TaxID=8032 RepID=UPI00113259BD|nr:period circadian protein homolog 2-like [Salmo trutta]
MECRLLCKHLSLAPASMATMMMMMLFRIFVFIYVYYVFAVAVSLITEKIVYISDQVATILHCNREQFTNAKFVEFLTPQDVNVFYSFPTPYHLPSWSMCTGSESSPTECRLEKSSFCRISGGCGRGGSLQYFLFRMTPYLMKVQVAELAEEQSCWLLLAERVQSGYDAPRIPSDKCIFTMTHTPSCVFQDIDESRSTTWAPVVTVTMAATVTTGMGKPLRTGMWLMNQANPSRGHSRRSVKGTTC